MDHLAIIDENGGNPPPEDENMDFLSQLLMPLLEKNLALAHALAHALNLALALALKLTLICTLLALALAIALALTLMQELVLVQEVLVIPPTMGMMNLTLQIFMMNQKKIPNQIEVSSEN